MEHTVAVDTKAAKLAAATELALDRLLEMLAVPIDLTDPKVDWRMVSQVKDVALQVVSQQIRVDQAQLRAREGEQLVEYEAAVARQEQLLEPAKGKAPVGERPEQLLGWRPGKSA